MSSSMSTRSTVSPARSCALSLGSISAFTKSLSCPRSGNLRTVREPREVRSSRDRTHRSTPPMGRPSRSFNCSISILNSSKGFFSCKPSSDVAVMSAMKERPGPPKSTSGRLPDGRATSCPREPCLERACRITTSHIAPRRCSSDRFRRDASPSTATSPRSGRSSSRRLCNARRVKIIVASISVPRRDAEASPGNVEGTRRVAVVGAGSWPEIFSPHDHPGDRRRWGDNRRSFRSAARPDRTTQVSPPLGAAAPPVLKLHGMGGIGGKRGAPWEHEAKVPRRSGDHESWSEIFFPPQSPRAITGNRGRSVAIVGSDPSLLRSAAWRW